MNTIPSIGDVVELNSGGPAMVVSQVRGDHISCVWINSQSNAQAETFYIQCIKLKTLPAPRRNIRGPSTMYNNVANDKN